MMQRKFIFQMKVKIQERCCMTIIYGCNVENLVLIEVIDKLWLKCRMHLNTYRVSWLQKGHHVTVT